MSLFRRKPPPVPPGEMLLGEGDRIILEVVGCNLIITLPMPTNEEARMTGREIAESLLNGDCVQLRPIEKART